MYKCIDPLPENAGDMNDRELSALKSVWHERKQELEKENALELFLVKLHREWAIETGIIERLYQWDRGVTQVLIEQGIDASLIAHKGGLSKADADNVSDIIKDQLSIVEGLFTFVKREQPLTEHFIRSLQQQFTAHQRTTEALDQFGNRMQVDILRGQYKIRPNNPKRPDGETHEYCPPELVPQEMQRLVQIYREHEDSFAPEVLSAWLHHRFTQIHPFQDGNGRVARTLASLVFLRDGLFPVVVRDSDRREYIEALETADAGDLSKLVSLFVKRQRQSLLSAIGLEQQVQQQTYVDDIIRSGAMALRERESRQVESIDRVYKNADELQSTTFTRLTEIANDLTSQIADIGSNRGREYSAFADKSLSNEERSNYYYAQIVDTAKRFEYYANLDVYKSWSHLCIKTESKFHLVISIHGYGFGKSGVLAASACTFRRLVSDDNRAEIVDLSPSITDFFQFNYAEQEQGIAARYKEWLEVACAIALSEWKRTLNP